MIPIAMPDAPVLAIPGSRTLAIALIAGAHVLIALGAMSMRIERTVPEALPLEVVIVQPPPTSRPATPMPQVPVPVIKAPDIRLPTPPVMESTITVRLEDRPPPPQATAPVAVAVAAPAAAPSVEPPRYGMAYLNNPAPTYPVMSRRGREQGRVLLRVSVSAAGTVDAIEIQESSGFQRLDDAALATVRRWRFLPARAGTEAVPGKALVPINFELS